VRRSSANAYAKSLFAQDGIGRRKSCVRHVGDNYNIARGLRSSEGHHYGSKGEAEHGFSVGDRLPAT
jgi:hypothetical protein